MKSPVPLVAIASLLTSAVWAADLSDADSADNSQYNLFHPTPSNLLRPLNSDQFDNVLDARTLDAGHVELETSLVNFYSFSGDTSQPGFSEHLSTKEYTWGPRLRVGLWPNVEFEVSSSYTTASENLRVTVSAPFVPFDVNQNFHFSSFGNVGFGPKINLWGNDDGPTALGVHPFLSVPTGFGDVLGGVDVPFGWRLPLGFYVKLDTQFYLTEGFRHTHYVGYYNSVSIHKSVCSRAEVYWFLDSTVVSQSEDPWFGETGFGLGYNATADLQFFAGIGFGLNSPASYYNPRVGVICRL